MKKYLLFAFGAAVALSSNAQHRNATMRYDQNSSKFIDEDAKNNLVKPISVPNAKAPSSFNIGTSFNIYSTLGNRQNQVVYNPATNIVAFGHRQNAGGSGPTGFESGVMSFDVSTDGGATWTVNPFQTTPDLGGGNGNRFPNIGLYNPANNTDPSNIFIVQSGPSLDTGSLGENGWSRTFRTSAKLDGSNVSETYDFNSTIGPNNDPNDWGAAGLYVNALGDAWYVTTTINNQGALGAEDPAFNIEGDFGKYVLVKGTFNATNNNFDWIPVDTIVPNWLTTGEAGAKTNIAGLANMAWSVDGQTGYMVAMGASSNLSTTNTMYRPYVVKTTDGGATWNEHPDFDFSTDPIIQCGVQETAAGSGIYRPFFSAYDVVVDSDDELRIFAHIRSGSSNHPDSANFIFTARQTGNLYEVATNGSGWDVNFVDSIYVDNFIWDATNNIANSIRPQAGRSADGTKTFYTWTISEPTFSTEREFPNVAGIGHDIATGKWTPVTNLTTGVSGSEFVAAYPTLSVDVIEDGDDKKWELPIVHATAPDGAAINNALGTTQWRYIKGIGFDQADFTNDPVNLCTVGINDNYFIDNNVSVYPNPSTGIIEIKLTNITDFNYTIVDIVGNEIANNNVFGTKTIVNLNNNALGVYFVTINTANGSTTRKVLLTK